MKLRLASLILALLASPTSSLAKDGGGSSTGGGHVRVCLTPAAATQVKSTLIENAKLPGSARDPFVHLNEDDILKVELLDLIEQPAIAPYVKKYFASMGRLMEGNATDQTGSLNKLKLLSRGAEQAGLDLEGTGFSAFEMKESPIQRGLRLIINQANWSASPVSLPLTDDFDPKIENPSNCVFAQVVRQTVLSPTTVRLVYDPRLLAKMPTTDVVALGLHEAIYNAVLRAPRFLSFKHPSVTTRQLTVLSIGELGAQNESNYFEHIGSIMEGLGYGPYGDMIRPFHRESVLEWAEDMNQTNGGLPSKGWDWMCPDENDPRYLKWARNHKGMKLRVIRGDHYD